MKTASLIARLLLGLIFVIFGLNFFLHFISMPPPPKDSAAGMFMAATYPTGFLMVVHVLEILGGALLLIGRFVNLGLTLVGPIVVNILLFHFLIAGGNYALPVVMGVLALLVLVERKEFVGVLLKP